MIETGGDHRLRAIERPRAAAIVEAYLGAIAMRRSSARTAGTPLIPSMPISTMLTPS